MTATNRMDIIFFVSIIIFVMVALVALILCTLASFLPARVVSSTDPVTVIAYGW